MRTIKFRAWNNSWKVKVMLYFGLFDTDGGFCSKDATDIRDAIIMQYTGLKDKSGKEIYEGDILRNTATDGILIVKWDNDTAEYYSHYPKTPNTRFPFGGYGSEHFEVIGNIYENKELLTKK